MALLIIGFTLWALCSAIKSSQQRARERRRQAEIEKIRREQARQREAWRRQQAEAREWYKRQQELEREAVRLAHEQERQRREQERQAAQIARQEEKLAQLQQKITLAEREIEHFAPIVDTLRQEQQALAYKVEYFNSIGLACGGYKARLEKVNSKLYKAETQLIKAQFARQNAQRRKEAAA